MSYCDHCKTNDGPHFVPPSCGEPGFYYCATAQERFAVFKTYYEEVLANYVPGSPKWLDAKEWLERNAR